MLATTPPKFQPLTGLYEPSAIQQLPDGRFLVVEDEKDHSFSLVTIAANGEVSSKSLGPAWFHGGDPIWKLDDLEGLTLDGAGHLSDGRAPGSGGCGLFLMPLHLSGGFWRSTSLLSNAHTATAGRTRQSFHWARPANQSHFQFATQGVGIFGQGGERR